MGCMFALWYLITDALKGALLLVVKWPLRILAFLILSFLGLIKESPYSQAAANSSGYTSSLSTSWGHCLAFRRRDGSLQFYW
jgi:hypothetical protein